MPAKVGLKTSRENLTSLGEWRYHLPPSKPRKGSNKGEIRCRPVSRTTRSPHATSLSVDIAWTDRDSEEAERGGSVRVVWRDGYVATMGLAIGHEPACWMLEVADSTSRPVGKLGVKREAQR